MHLCTARMELKLTFPEFYSLTPRLLAMFLKSHRAKADQEREHFEYMFAQQTLWTMYSGMSRPTDPIEIRDLMPSQRNRKPPTKEEKNAAFTARLREFNKQLLKARS
jgi:hypothetical protein